MIKFICFAVLVVIVSSRQSTESNIAPQNNSHHQVKVTVTPNCLHGQMYIAGQCREVWKQGQYGLHNVINVPPNCPSEQQLINGQCRDVWRQNVIEPTNVVTVPPNCPDGQEWVNGQCRDIWRQTLVEPMNVVTVPPNCPNGQEWVNGQCREIWRQNVIEPMKVVAVPPNCPTNQEYINGHCRDVRIKQNGFPINLGNSESMNLFKILRTQRITRSADEAKATKKNRNIISVPNQCPNGQMADSLGICRPIFD